MLYYGMTEAAILQDGYRFFVTCLQDIVHHPKQQTAEYLTNTYGVNPIQAWVLANRIQVQYANLSDEIDNIPW